MEQSRNGKSIQFVTGVAGANIHVPLYILIFQGLLWFYRPCDPQIWFKFFSGTRKALQKVGIITRAVSLWHLKLSLSCQLLKKSPITRPAVPSRLIYDAILSLSLCCQRASSDFPLWAEGWEVLIHKGMFSWPESPGTAALSSQAERIN